VSAQVHDRITIEPGKMDGQPCIRGLRFLVVTVLRMIAGGMVYAGNPLTGPVLPKAAGECAFRTSHTTVG